MFPVYGGKCLSCKAVRNWVEKRDKPFTDDKGFESEFLKLLRTIKCLLCCGFRRTGKAMGQVNQCWWRICRVRVSHILRFISICELFTDSPSYMKTNHSSSLIEILKNCLYTTGNGLMEKPSWLGRSIFWCVNLPVKYTKYTASVSAVHSFCFIL
jgi:hypothetical protein